MKDTVFVIFVIVLLIGAIACIARFLYLLIDDYLRKKGYRTRILEPLVYALNRERLKSLNDVLSIIESSGVEPYSKNPENYIEKILSDLRAYKLTKNENVFGFNSTLFDALSEELEQRKRTEPFKGLPHNERDLLEDILTMTKGCSSSTHLESKIRSLSDILLMKERNMQDFVVKNRTSYRLSIISFIVGVISMLLTIVSLIQDFISTPPAS